MYSRTLCTEYNSTAQAKLHTPNNTKACKNTTEQNNIVYHIYTRHRSYPQFPIPPHLPLSLAFLPFPQSSPRNANAHSTRTRNQRSRHLTIPTTTLRSIISPQHTSLRLIGLRESIATLFAHALHLADFTDCLLELFHSTHIHTHTHTHTHISQALPINGGNGYQKMVG